MPTLGCRECEFCLKDILGNKINGYSSQVSRNENLAKSAEAWGDGRWKGEYQARADKAYAVASQMQEYVDATQCGRDPANCDNVFTY